MSKIRRRKRGGHKLQPTGLPSVRDTEQRLQDEFESTGVGDSGDPFSVTVVCLLEKLQSPSAEDKQCACSTIANLVTTPHLVNELLRANLVKIVGPMLVDQSLDVRQAALGALRNLSVEGGPEICHKMVEQDIMTPLVALIQMYIGDWSQDKRAFCEAKEVLIQATHLLWNVCENSQSAVKIFNAQNLLANLFPCLEPTIYGHSLSCAVAHCLYTVTENNPELCTELSKEQPVRTIETLMTTESHTAQEGLFRTLCAGILYNVSLGKLSSSSGNVVMGVVSVLAEILDCDVIQRLLEITEHLTNLNITANGAMSDTEVEEIKEKKKADVDNEMQAASDLLCAQKLALELIANLSCDTDDDEWEDLEDSSDTSSEDAVMDLTLEPEPESSVLSSLCVPAEVHSAFSTCNIFNKVMQKMTPSPASVRDTFSSTLTGQKLVENVVSLQTRALLCLSNIVSATQVDDLCDMDSLYNVWITLSGLCVQSQVKENLELLEAVTSAMRAVLEKLGKMNSSRFSNVGESDLNFLYEMGRQCTDAQVRANAVRIVSTIGSLLANHGTAHPFLKVIGVFLCDVATNDVELWVIAEALDAIFDVFAEDQTDPIVQEIQLIETLKPLVPLLKTKIRHRRKELGEHLPIIITTRTNLARFIKYKTERLLNSQ